VTVTLQLPLSETQGAAGRFEQRHPGGLDLDPDGHAVDVGGDEAARGRGIDRGRTVDGDPAVDPGRTVSAGRRVACRRRAIFAPALPTTNRPTTNNPRLSLSMTG
jgi:hypothetical protein